MKGRSIEWFREICKVSLLVNFGVKSGLASSQLMAVSVQQHLYPKPGMWNLGEHPANFSTGSDGLPAAMAYEYPQSVLESSMIPSYHHPPTAQEQSNSPASTTPLSPGGNTHGTSLRDKSTKIKRAMSTPNVRGHATTDATSSALSADKRRNKLGYHRTSVACGKLAETHNTNRLVGVK